MQEVLTQATRYIHDLQQEQTDVPDEGHQAQQQESSADGEGCDKPHPPTTPIASSPDGDGDEEREEFSPALFDEEEEEECSADGEGGLQLDHHVLEKNGEDRERIPPEDQEDAAGNTSTQEDTLPPPISSGTVATFVTSSKPVSLDDVERCLNAMTTVPELSQLPLSGDETSKSFFVVSDDGSLQPAGAVEVVENLGATEDHCQEEGVGAPLSTIMLTCVQVGSAPPEPGEEVDVETSGDLPVAPPASENADRESCENASELSVTESSCAPADEGPPKSPGEISRENYQKLVAEYRKVAADLKKYQEAQKSGNSASEVCDKDPRGE